MLSLKQAVFPPVTLKLHWPDRWSPCCLTEVTVLPLELYQCVSCGQISLGRTEYVEGHVVANARDS